MPSAFETPESVMRRALELAAQGAGFVEPNPMVGAVVVDDDLQLLGEGYHQRFGGPHAEVHALHQAGERARGATLYVTLEPCCHQGKTPPCTAAVLAAGIKRVCVAALDPFPAVAGQGVAQLRAAGVIVETGLLEVEAVQLTAPFRTLIQYHRPFVIAKWAMSLDGKMAARTRISRWISNAASRAIVHQLRGRMDGILVGIGTVLADAPLLTARPAGPRMASRIVLDSHARLPLLSHLVRTAEQTPVLVFVTPAAPIGRVAALQAAGVEVISVTADARQHPDIAECLQELGRRRLTNVLVEGGSAVLGEFFDRQLIDEVQVFIAPILIGGQGANSPLGGQGLDSPEFAKRLSGIQVTNVEGDVFVRGRLSRYPDEIR
ncbi:MAG: Diaminohydroxyphosphoribosylaminopyrimidine deaminase [Planctomycetaceae bacterium]|nr:Diaminohydroxyphosphoribosylaminopyrimidine deaminase [Planctomycetaceae bacterium]